MPDRIDDMYSEKWFSDMEKTVELLYKQEAALKAVNDAIKAGAGEAKGAKSMEELAAAAGKVHQATQQAAVGFDDFNAAISLAEALKAKYNGSSKEMVTITLASAKAANQLAQAAQRQEAANRTRATSASATERAAKAEAKAMGELSNEYGILSKAYNEAQLRAKNYYLTLGATHASTVTAIADAKKLSDELKKLDAAVGINNRSVGDYTLATRGLRGSMQQIARELPSISNGFATFASAIGNNIAPAQDAIRDFVREQKALREAGKPAQSLLQGLAGAIFNWQTALLLAVTALTIYGKEIGNFVTSLFKGKEALDSATLSADALNKAFSETTYTNAVQQINELGGAIKLAKDGLIDKEKVVRLYNHTLGQTTGEVKSLSEAEAAYIKNKDAYIQMMLFKAAATEAYQEAAKQAVKAQVDLNNLGKEADQVSDYVKFTGGVPFPNVAADKRRTEEAAAAQKQSNTLLGIAENFNKRAAEIAKKSGFDFFSGTEDEKVTKPKKAKREKAIKDESTDIYKTLIAQSEEYAATQKAISEDLDNEYDVRLAAFDAYFQEQILLAGLYAASAESGEADMQNRITQATIKGLKERKKLTDPFVKGNINDAGVGVSNSNTSGANDSPEARDRRAEEAYRKQKAQSDKVFTTAQDLANIYSGITERRLREIDKEIEAINRKRDAEIAAYQESAEFAFATEKEKAQKLAAINAQAAAKERELNEQKRSEQRRDAQIHKAINVAKIAIETALAVIHQATSGDVYTAFGRAAAVGFIGAAQLAAAIAQPIPEFAEGTGPEGSPEGVAKVGERGAELGITPGGKVFLTPSSETKMYLEKGTHILPADKTAEILKYYAIGMPQLRQNPGKQYAMDEIMEGAANKIVGAIERKKFPSQQVKPGWWDKYQSQKTK